MCGALKNDRSPDPTTPAKTRKLRPIEPQKAEETGLLMVAPGAEIQLADIDPSAQAARSKAQGQKQAEKLRGRLEELQQKLYAEHQRSLLIVVQAMDTGGKDGAIARICHGLDPNGVQLTNFKYPSAEEWEHDFLWRVHHATPRKGSIGIWNRSHYEDVLVPRVHNQISDEVWQARCDDINAFERLLTNNGVTMVKFFLHISKEEQKARLEARLKDAQKLWKFNPGDLKERALWEDYQRAYEAVINRSSHENAPWFVVSANHKWSRNLVMLRTIVAALEQMDPQYPAGTFDPASVVIE